MTSLQKTVLCLLIPATAGALTGCQTDDPRKNGGTYTAARHHMLGSNIPQPSDAENGSTVYGGPQDVGGPQVMPNRAGVAPGVPH